MVTLAGLVFAGLVCWCDLDDDELFLEEIEMPKASQRVNERVNERTSGVRVNERFNEAIPSRPGQGQSVPGKPGPGVGFSTGTQEPLPPVNKPKALPGATARIKISAIAAAKNA